MANPLIIDRSTSTGFLAGGSTQRGKILLPTWLSTPAAIRNSVAHCVFVELVVFVFSYVCVCACVSVRDCIYVRMCVRIVCMCAYVCVHACMYVYVYVCTRMCAHIREFNQ
jgi:hypothetical protein